MSSFIMDLWKNPVVWISKALIVIAGGFAIVSTVAAGLIAIWGVMTRNGMNMIFDAIPSYYLWTALIGGILLTVFAVYWSKYQDAQKKKGEMEFDKTYAISALFTIIISTLIGSVILFEGCEYVLSTPVESTHLACVGALIVGAASAWFVDAWFSNRVANGYVAKEIIAAQELTRKFMESEQVKKALFQTVSDMCEKRGITDAEVVKQIADAVKSADDPSLKVLIDAYAPKAE